ncbi:hypothetical protein [Siphonobacter sp. SORGH_AS_1065]|nr:hypothetical protein [Siphonobacter sp. SORGH_AS_1065]MDQ1090511.1 hypothetical protein [Siphonobacter sp. SORGH_AS_1065]
MPEKNENRHGVMALGSWLWPAIQTNEFPNSTFTTTQAQRLLKREN